MFDPEIASLSNEQLLAVIAAFGHDVPPVYIDELYLRGSKAEENLMRLLADDAIWTAQEEEEICWMPVHWILALGKLTSEESGFAIAECIRRYARDNVEILDWVSSFWLALLANKPDSVLRSFEPTMLDRTASGYLRLISFQVATMLARRVGAESLDKHLAILAEVVADETEDLEFRQHVAAHLLEFPRPQHRAALERLADVHSAQGIMYSAADVLAAYERGYDTPEWERLNDPWVFYAEEAVQARYVEDPEDLAELADMLDEDFEPHLGETFIRESPKVGRNDPCPCGSGKKYKKCCLGRD